MKTRGEPPVRPVVVEVVVLRAVPEGGLAYRSARGGLLPDEDPVRAARRLAGAGEWVHSTSWRYTDEGHVVLTFAVAPEPEEWRPAKPLAETGIARGPLPGRPAPDAVSVEQVAAHAVRHLAFLAAHDPVAGGFLAGHPLLARALEAWPGGVAGQLTG
ncbi:hypothetical protein [Actinocorallia populi]|uniref:hypothetical protein n=1 Tax=Actinocorallia populi TaxID=2079200 RepID=UPI0013001C60|nr:hypothetical protein [Actinocorallia populi]